jgi:hypothetical protein
MNWLLAYSSCQHYGDQNEERKSVSIPQIVSMDDNPPHMNACRKVFYEKTVWHLKRIPINA